MCGGAKGRLRPEGFVGLGNGDGEIVSRVVWLIITQLSESWFVFGVRVS